MAGKEQMRASTDYYDLKFEKTLLSWRNYMHICVYVCVRVVSSRTVHVS